MTARELATKMVEVLLDKKGPPLVMLANRPQYATHWNVLAAEDAHHAKGLARLIRQLVVDAISESQQQASGGDPPRNFTVDADHRHRAAGAAALVRRCLAEGAAKRRKRRPESAKARFPSLKARPRDLRQAR